MKLSQEVIDMMAEMKIKSDFSNVRRQVNNASLAKKVKYRRAVLDNAVNNLLNEI